MPHSTFGKLTIRMFSVINSCIAREENSIEIGDTPKRLTLDALTLAGFGKLIRQITIYLRSYHLTYMYNLHLGFDINSLGDPQNEWLQTYKNIIKRHARPNLFRFSKAGISVFTLISQQKPIHKDCDKFLKLMNDMIERKRKAVESENNKQVSKSSSSETFSNHTREKIEKDILTLLLESEKNDNDKSAYITNQEILVM